MSPLTPATEIIKYRLLLPRAWVSLQRLCDPSARSAPSAALTHTCQVEGQQEGSLGARKRGAGCGPQAQEDLSSNPTPAIYKLCNFKQVTSPLWSTSSPVNQRGVTFLREKLLGSLKV